MDKVDIAKLTYEQAFSALEQIVTKLESEDQSLEEMLSLSEDGQKLAEHCSALLEKAQLRIQKIEPAK